MPVFTISEIRNMNAMLVRSLRTHSVSQRERDVAEDQTQYDQPIGPNMRFHIMKYSQCDAEYHAMNTSMP